MTGNADPAARAGAVLSIDLAAIAANWRLLAAMVGPQAQAAAVVKADAYGLGAARVAPALRAAGCRRFFAATLDEGIALREILPGAEILVLSGPFAGTAGEYLAHSLLPVLNTTEQVAAWTSLARGLGRRLPAVLHVDTGMARLGLALADLRLIAEDSATLALVAPVLVMSHLACADEPGHALNRIQLERFAAARALFPGLRASLAASSGIFLGSAWHADWVRPGAALYGVNPTPWQANPMAQVVRLQGRIVQLREIDAGESVGYGATHLAPGRSRLAVVAAGYADGLPRALGNRGSAILGDTRVPLVGRVSMDIVVFDVTAVPPERVRPGDLLELIGPGNSVDDVARAAGTIGYEILTALGARYHRVYHDGTAG